MYLITSFVYGIRIYCSNEVLDSQTIVFKLTIEKLIQDYFVHVWTTQMGYNLYVYMNTSKL